MSETKFTKGPWLAFTNTIGSYTVNCKTPKDESASQFSPTVCGIWPAAYSDLKGDEYADASLIASAPEMYEMLESLLQNEECDVFEMGSEINELLAKARGEQQ